jgi:hypothetical protein
LINSCSTRRTKGTRSSCTCREATLFFCEKEKRHFIPHTLINPEGKIAAVHASRSTVSRLLSAGRSFVAAVEAWIRGLARSCLKKMRGHVGQIKWTLAHGSIAHKASAVASPSSSPTTLCVHGGDDGFLPCPSHAACMIRLQSDVRTAGYKCMHKLSVVLGGMHICDFFVRLFTFEF